MWPSEFGRRWNKRQCGRVNPRFPYDFDLWVATLAHIPDGPAVEVTPWRIFDPGRAERCPLEQTSSRGDRDLASRAAGDSAI